MPDLKTKNIMSILTKLLRDSYDLQESKGEKTAYWHLQKLRQAIKDEQIKGETLPIDSVSICVCGTEEHQESQPRADHLTYCSRCDKPY